MVIAATYGTVGNANTKTAGTTLVIPNTFGAVIPAGTFIHITGCWDSIASVTAPTITCSTVGGGTAIANHATAIGSGVTTTAGAGVWHQCFRVLTTADIAIGATLATLTSNQSAVARVAHAYGWTGASTTLRGTVTTGTSTTGAPTVTTTGTALVAGDLVIGSASYENNAAMTDDFDTLNGSWLPGRYDWTTGGSAVTNVGVIVQNKVVTATGAQTYNPTGGGADTVACVYSLVPLPDPTITQSTYRFYADDGNEFSSTALGGGYDTPTAANASVGDVNLHLRTRLQSTNTGIPYGTDDYQLQYEKNASGTWVNVAAGDPVVVPLNSANLTDGEATSNRLVTGTGSFSAGKVSEDGLVDNLGWTANNYTDLLYALTVKQAGVVHGDTIRFRVLRNGLTTGMTYTQVPTLTVTLIPVAVTQAAYRVYADGTEAGSVALAAQDAAYTADLTASDANLLVRTRLQSTSVTSLPSTDDWQLQWERNASGVWSKVSDLIDYYDPANATTYSQYAGTNQIWGQSFLGDGRPLTRAGFHLRKIGAPPGVLSAFVWAHTGTYGVDGLGTGNPLASASAAKACIALSTTERWEDWVFDGSFTPVAGTPYVFGISLDTAGDASNQVQAGVDTTGVHGGNYIYRSAGTWGLQQPLDTIFRVYGSTDVLADGYDETNADGTSVSFGSAAGGIGQSFLGDGGKLVRASFWARKIGTPPALSVTAELYAHTGTFGSTGLGTGPALATSTSRVATSFLTGFQWEDFTFDGTYTLVAGTPYVIVLSQPGGFDVNTLQLASDGTAPTHPGTRETRNSLVSWTVDATRDMIFRVYTGPPVLPYDSASLTEGAATTNRLGAGTGSFAAGRVSELGQVFEFGWAGNNYTELLYALTLKQAALINGDTLRFRVLRNGAVTGLTHTQVPTIPVTITAAPRTGQPKVWTGSAFANKPAKVWTGSAWVEKPVKVWSGSAWVLAK